MYVKLNTLKPIFLYIKAHNHSRFINVKKLTHVATEVRAINDISGPLVSSIRDKIFYLNSRLAHTYYSYM